MINHPGCIILPSGVTKNFQIRKIQCFDKSDTDISDLKHFEFEHFRKFEKIYTFFFVVNVEKIRKKLATGYALHTPHRGCTPGPRMLLD